MKTLMTVIVTVSVIALGSTAMSAPVVTQVTTNAYEDSFPRIQGDYVVWQGHVDGNWEIFLYDMAGKESTRITSNDYNDLSPQTDGKYVVWQGIGGGTWDIFLWDGVDVRNISDPGADDTSPQIADGLVVWTSQPVEDDVNSGDIVFYDIETGTSFVLSAQVDPDNALDDTSPRIDGNVVFWLQTDDQGGVTSFVYGIHDGTVTENPGYVWPGNPQVDGNLTVLTRYDGSDREIFLYNSAPKHHHQVTDNDLEDEYPSLSGNRMAWVARGDIFVATYNCLALLSPRHDGCCNGGVPTTFAWEAIGYSEFRIEFSEDPDFPASRTIAFPASTTQCLTDESFTPTRAAWSSVVKMTPRQRHLYWRVSGKDGEGHVDYSEVRHLTVKRAGPSSRNPVHRSRTISPVRPIRAF